MSPDKSGEYIKNVHIQIYKNYCFHGSYLNKQNSKLCSVQPTETRDLVLCQHVTVPQGVNVIVDSNISGKKGSHLLEFIMLCNNRTNTNRAISLNKGKQSGIKAYSSFSKPFSHI